MAKCKNLVSGYKTFKNILLQNYSTKFLDYCTQIEQSQFEHSKFNANFGNLLLQNCSMEFLDIANKYFSSPWSCVIKFVQMVASPTSSAKLYPKTI